MKNKKLSIGLISLLVFNLYGASKVGVVGKPITTSQPSRPALDPAKKAQIQADIAQVRKMFPLSKEAAALREAKEAAAAKAAKEAAAQRVLSKQEQNSVKKLVGSAFGANVRAERSQNKPDELIARELNAISSSLKGGSLTDEAAAKVLQLRDQVAFRDINNKDYEKTLNAWVTQAEAKLAGRVNSPTQLVTIKPAAPLRVGAAAKGVYGKDAKTQTPRKESEQPNTFSQLNPNYQTGTIPVAPPLPSASNVNKPSVKSEDVVKASNQSKDSQSDVIQQIKDGVTLKKTVTKEKQNKPIISSPSKEELLLMELQKRRKVIDKEDSIVDAW